MVTEGTESEQRTSHYLSSSAAVVYLILGVGALIWSFLRSGRLIPESVFGGRPGESLAIGLGLAAAVLIGTGYLMRGKSLLHWFALEVRALLGPIDWQTAVTLGLLSGIGEELFFRGAMQPALGFVPTSILFGLLHIGPDRRYLPWTLFAVVMGFLFGWILLATGSLVGSTVAHVLINIVNLRRIGRLDLPRSEQA